MSILANSIREKLTCLYNNLERNTTQNYYRKKDAYILFFTEVQLTEEFKKKIGYQSCIIDFIVKCGSAMYRRERIEFCEVRMPFKIDESLLVMIKTQKKNYQI